MRTRALFLSVVTLITSLNTTFADSLLFEVKSLTAEVEQDTNANANIKGVIPKVTVPENAKLNWAVEIAAQPDVPFHSKTTLGTQSLQIDGTLKKRDDGKYQINYSYKVISEAAGTLSTKSLKTMMVLAENQEFASASLVIEGKQTFMVLKLSKQTKSEGE